MSSAAQRLSTHTKNGEISSMWEMDDNARRLAVIKRASKGATRALRSTNRDVLVIEPSSAVRSAIMLHLHLPSDAPTWKRILFETAIKHAMTPSEMLSHRRSKAVVAARQEAMWRMRNETTMSMPAIGRRMERDHTTVLHGIRKHEAKIQAAKVEVSL